MSREKRKRNYVFTSFGLTSDELEVALPHPDVTYICWGEELCPTTGRPHLQGYLELARALGFTRVRAILGDDTVHLGGRKGSSDQAVKYCKKDGKVRTCASIMPRRCSNACAVSCSLPSMGSGESKASELTSSSPGTYSPAEARCEMCLQRLPTTSAYGTPRSGSPTWSSQETGSPRCAALYCFSTTAGGMSLTRSVIHRSSGSGDELELGRPVLRRQNARIDWTSQSTGFPVALATGGMATTATARSSSTTSGPRTSASLGSLGF